MSNLKNELFIPLEGVSSEHCALIVDKRLSKVDGITSHRVEMNNNRAVIQSEDRGVLSKAVAAIREIGYEVTSKKQSFPVLQMSCASCAKSVERVLSAQKGVVDASVNYANARVYIEYFPDQIQASMIKEAVQNGGYDLVIEEDSAGDSPIDQLQEEKLSQIKLRTYWALGLSSPVVVIGMFFMDMPYANEIMWILSTPVILWLGRYFFINAWKQAKHRSANMDTLVALSTGTAYIFSAFNTLFPQFWHAKGLEAHVYFEAAAVIIAFILLGKLLEEKAKGNTSSAIQKLMGLQPKSVTIIREDMKQVQIPIEQVGVGQTIVVKPGEKIAVDGVLIHGHSYVDESMLSGEPIPVLKEKDDKVFAGTINQKGSFHYKAEKVGSDTMLAQIIKMVQDAQGSKAPVQKLVDKIAGVFVPIVMLIAVIAFMAWNILGGENAFTQGLLAMITVLVIACPCALGLATPTAIMVGVGKGAEKGILIKDAESLEMARQVNAVILDKTGTITQGKPSVTSAHWTDDNPRWKAILASMERHSEHPLADALIKHLDMEGSIELDSFESMTGKGVMAVVEGSTYYAGNKRLLLEVKGALDSSLSKFEEKWSEESQTVIYFFSGDEILALLAISDPIKESSKKAVWDLQKKGVEVFMLTGDNEHTARAVAQSVGILHYKAEVLPAEKAAFVKKLQSEGKMVAMVGDGINDSTALAQADVSIAMGKGSDIAMDVAKMTIISSDLSKIPEAISLSKASVRTIQQNLFWAFIYNIIGIPLAAGVLYPINGFLLNPMLAGAAMAFSSVSVVGNSLRLKYAR